MSFYRQPLSYQCGPFALKYAMVMLGKMEHEDEIEKEAGSSWWAGTNEIGLARAAKAFDCWLDEMAIEDRTYNFKDKFIREMYDNAEQDVMRKIEEFDNR